MCSIHEAHLTTEFKDHYIIKPSIKFYDTNKKDVLSKLLKKDDVKNPFFINNAKVELTTLPFVFRFKMNIEFS